MINIDDVTKEHHPNWTQIFDQQCETLIIKASESGENKCII